MAYNVAVDVGGTFTDVLVFDEESGELTEGKVLSTPEDPSRGVVEGIETVCEKVGIGFTDLNLLFHGTTVVTNMILTNTGSRVGLLTTRGHEQILHLARAWTPGPLYGWMALVKPDPPADPTDTVGISERIGADGGVITELDEEQVRQAVTRLVSRGVESLAIGFLNSYGNPEDKVFFNGEWMETPIYERGKLRPGNKVAGPAVVAQDDTTSVIEPGYSGAVDRYGNILIEEA